ncbi:MAG: methylated-DNA-[protein]-cysteine S-methyltransferase [Candidatus Dependentiae bacterium]|nr:methylated-DNA-[protein]-cysteine S-methyltransferase [Candidatus Dependentiae bacterium]
MSETIFTYHTSQHDIGSYTTVFENNLLCFLGIGPDAAVEALAQWPTAEPVTNPETLALIETLLTAPRLKVECVLYGNPLQVDVWNELTKIPYGATMTYQEIAQRIGRPEAVRAVANAIGRNQISVVIPCHRVIGSDGTMRGYRWGIEVKEALLKQEKEAKEKIVQKVEKLIKSRQLG